MKIPVKYGFELEVPPKSFFAESLLQDQCYEEMESQLVIALLQPGDIAMDAGSHAGYFACLMASRGATVYAVEPNPTLCKLTELNTDQKNVTVVHAALTDVNGAATFHMPSEYDDGWGSLVAADETRKFQDEIKVLTIRLDSILPTGRIKFIKIDVEGSELPALRGLGARLEDVDYILIECVDIPFRVAKCDSTVEGINALLADWAVKEPVDDNWVAVNNAYSDLIRSKNFLFTNPRIHS